MRNFNRAVCPRPSEFDDERVSVERSLHELHDARLRRRPADGDHQLRRIVLGPGTIPGDACASVPRDVGFDRAARRHHDRRRSSDCRLYARRSAMVAVLEPLKSDTPFGASYYRQVRLSIVASRWALCLRAVQPAEAPNASAPQPAALQCNPVRGSCSRSSARVATFPLRIDGTAFVDAAGKPFAWRGVSAFRLAEMISAGKEPEVIRYLDWMASRSSLSRACC